MKFALIDDRFSGLARLVNLDLTSEILFGDLVADERFELIYRFAYGASQPGNWWGIAEVVHAVDMESRIKLLSKTPSKPDAFRLLTAADPGQYPPEGHSLVNLGRAFYIDREDDGGSRIFFGENWSIADSRLPFDDLARTLSPAKNPLLHPDRLRFSRWWDLWDACRSALLSPVHIPAIELALTTLPPPKDMWPGFHERLLAVLDERGLRRSSVQ